MYSYRNEHSPDCDDQFIVAPQHHSGINRWWMWHIGCGWIYNQFCLLSSARSTCKCYINHIHHTVVHYGGVEETCLLNCCISPSRNCILHFGQTKLGSYDITSPFPSPACSASFILVEKQLSSGVCPSGLDEYQQDS